MLESSIFLFIIKKLLLIYARFEDYLDKTSRGSLICISFKKPLGIIKNSFEFSFLGRITDDKARGEYINPLNSSLLCQRIKKISRHSFIYTKSSVINGLPEESKKDFYILSIRNAGFTIIIIILTNIFFSILFKVDIDFLGWFMRIFMLFFAFIGLSSSKVFK